MNIELKSYLISMSPPIAHVGAYEVLDTYLFVILSLKVCYLMILNVNLV